jgi:hypothetical protein
METVAHVGSVSTVMPVETRLHSTHYAKGVEERCIGGDLQIEIHETVNQDSADAQYRGQCHSGIGVRGLTFQFPQRGTKQR